MQRFSLVLTLACLSSVSASASEPSKADIDFFEKKIRPVLVNQCLECHTASQKPKGKLALDSRDGVLKGGRSGPALVPGKPGESLLIEALRHDSLKMPPKTKLPAAVVADFVRWIEMGAPDPRTSASSKDYKRAEPSDLWAFRKPAVPPTPKLKDPAWATSEIDRLILARLEEKKLKPNGPADRAALLRRVTFDLIGLPPTPDEIDAFVNDSSPDAYEKVVDRLLASPHFGERWARHWFDVVHYAENSGIPKYDAPYPAAWKYRDWVIAAFQNDMPYDLFVRAQIAGDLLPAKSDQERVSNQTATGMLVVGRIRFGDPQSTMDSIDEQIDAVTQGFLGLTVSCARCHDHKFDPISIQDYYSLAGIFRSSAPVFPKGADDTAKAGKNAKAVKKNAKGEKNAPTSRAQLEPGIMGVSEAAKITDCAVLFRGDIANPGAVVPRGLPAVFTGGAKIAIASTESGRRQLAEWIASPDNPLTARVYVNRLWHHLFGRGLAPSVDNFGSMSEPVTHPELIDLLAVRFMERGWSTRAILREIALSRTYRMSSEFSKANHDIDPENFYLWRQSQRRLDAEAIRDGILAVSGRLETRPLVGSLVKKGNVPVKGKASDLPESANRSVYLPIVRGRTPEVLQTFDFADPSLVIGRRDVTTVPTQSLFLMNNPFVIESSTAFARRLLAVKDRDDASRIDLAYRLAFGRSAKSEERERAHDYLAAYSKAIESEERNPGDRLEKTWSSFCQALFASAEFRYLR